MKEIYVQAQADHIESLAKATPISAIEELVWNALDADAREVRVDLITNALGGVEAVRVSDDGTGIDVLKADSTFGSLGGSWKRVENARTASSRRLHGCHGRGRFKAFALGSHVEWRTTVRVANELLSYVLAGDISKPGVFELDASPSPGPGTGTEVYVSNASVNCDALLVASETVQTLASKFALYLKSYPDVRIFFNGLPVTPVIVQRAVTDYAFELEGGRKAKLEVIEWKRKFAGAGKLVLAGPGGFELHELAPGVRSGGVSFTAYLVADRFPALAAENALVMGELNPEVREYLEAAKRQLKAHFAAAGADREKGLVAGWISDGSHPFADAGETEEKKRFDSLALELSSKLEGFGDLSSADRAVVFRLLAKAMGAVPKGSLKEFLK